MVFNIVEEMNQIFKKGTTGDLSILKEICFLDYCGYRNKN